MQKHILIIVAFILVMLGGCVTQAPSDFFKNTPSTTTLTRAKLTDDAFWQGDASTTWDRLQHTPLQKLASANDLDPTRLAWIKLATLSKQYNDDSAQLVQQIKIWQTQNPNHPGNQLIANNALNVLSNPTIPKHIALLLPLQGPMAANGKAVRDGFLSAYYASLSKTHAQQKISFYDTSNRRNLAGIYQQAIANGADVIVGPLIKEDVDALLSATKISVPTLALNYTDSSLPPNFYEFGLSPIDEAQQIADKAWQAGRSQALVIVLQNAWGERVRSNLISRWQSNGGKVTDTLYFTSQTDFNQSIPAFLQVNNPSADDKKMQKENNKLILEQRRRQDFDVIFLLAEPQSARQIVPLLKFNYAESIPIYATSSIYAGSLNPQRDTDLNGVIFADIPWLIRQGGIGSSHSNNRLYAVGRDAYTISSELPRLRHLPNFPIYAATGALTLTNSNKIYRRLPITQIRNGHA